MAPPAASKAVVVRGDPPADVLAAMKAFKYFGADNWPERVEVEAPAGGVFRLGNPWAGPAVVRRADGKQRRVAGRVLEIATSAGERLTIQPAP